MKNLNLKEGDKFNRLTLLKFRVDLVNQGWRGKWKCDCGNEKVIVNSRVISGHSTSCGCFRKEQVLKKSYKHGYSRKRKESPEYISWQSAKDRCFNINNKNFADYGGRGITFCEKWLDFKEFIKDMGDRPDNSYSLERIDYNKGYSPENCKWILKIDQPKNRRICIFVKVDDIKMNLKDACRYLNLKYSEVLYNFKKYKKLPENIKKYE